MADFPQFTGPGYTRPSLILPTSYAPFSQIAVQTDRVINWRLESVPGGTGKSPYALFRQPGLTVFSNTGIVGKVRGMYSLNGRLWAVVGSHVIQIAVDGTIYDYSVASGVYVGDDGLKVWMAANPTQVFIVSAGNGYILNYVNNSLTQIGDANFPQNQASSCCFMDGYFFVTIANTNTFQISALNNGLSWNSLNQASVESQPGNVVACIQLREEVWFFTNLVIQPFYDSPNGANFPIVPNQSAVINSGLMAAQSLCRIDQTLFWLKLDETSHGIFCRNDGYIDIRISNNAVESVWNTYANLSQAYAWTYQENGHSCVRVTFPDIDNMGDSNTFEYDLTTNQWSETPWLNPATNGLECHRGFCSAVAFDKILIGDRSNGNIYEMHSAFLDDASNLIYRERTTPHGYKSKNRIFYSRIEFDGNVGMGLNVAYTAPYFNPQALLSWSDDGGRTYGDIVNINFGKLGEYFTRPFYAPLGSGRDRVFKFAVTDPVDWLIAACRLDFEVGNS